MAILRKSFFFALLLIFPLSAFAQTGAYCRMRFFSQTSAAQGTGAAKTGTTHGLDLADLDRSANACLNLFQFADGGWVASHPIPPAYSTWGTFNSLLDHNQDVLHRILEEAAANKSAAPGSNEQKIGDYYASCMNEAGIEKEGITPLEPELKRIAAISTPQQLEAEVARLQTMGIGVMFRFGSTQDYKNSSQEIAMAGQDGLALPDRDYYVNPDQRSQKIRDAYVEHVQNMLN